jgi:hypothetical protein
LFNSSIPQTVAQIDNIAHKTIPVLCHAPNVVLGENQPQITYVSGNTSKKAQKRSPQISRPPTIRPNQSSGFDEITMRGAVIIESGKIKIHMTTSFQKYGHSV